MAESNGPSTLGRFGVPIVWAPQSVGRRRRDWDAIIDLQPGDILLHYGSGKTVVGINAVIEAATEAERPEEVNGLPEHGLAVETVFQAAVPLIPFDHIPPEWRYRRHHTPPPGLAVLVPELPNDDLLALVHEFGVSVIWRDNGIFSRVEPRGRPGM